MKNISLLFAVFFSLSTTVFAQDVFKGEVLKVEPSLFINEVCVFLLHDNKSQVEIAFAEEPIDEACAISSENIKPGDTVKVEYSQGPADWYSQEAHSLAILFEHFYPDGGLNEFRNFRSYDIVQEDGVIVTNCTENPEACN